MLKNCLLLIIVCLLSFSSVNAQKLNAYQIYNKEREPVDFTTMITQLSDYDVVLFGELHNSSINHWLELKTAEALYQLMGDSLVLGAEMFERDNQKAVNQYLFGLIEVDSLKKKTRLWSNFMTDYKPLLDFAKVHELEFVATNVPRRYAAIVVDHGLDSLKKLPKEDRMYIAEFPIEVDLETPGYKKMKTMMEEHAGDNVMNYIKAQAIKDATMAEFILKNRKSEELLLHFNGNFHSKKYGGVYWYLKKKKEQLEVAVITVAESDLAALPLPEDFTATEFNIVIPEDMTKTYITRTPAEHNSIQKEKVAEEKVSEPN